MRSRHVPAREDCRCGSNVTDIARSRPPSVERLLAAVRPRRPAGQDHEALAEAARSILAEERERLAAGDGPRTAADLAAALVMRLDGFAGSSGAGPASVVPPRQPSVYHRFEGAEGSRWVPRSSKPVAPRSA